MTHEQKPESAEFRTREAQRSELVRYLQGRETSMGGRGAEWVSQHVISEAEARGAAEQRRKDAEGAEPFGYFPKRLVGTGWCGATIKRECSPQSEPIIALYTRPANVAALEDRVKELEGEICSIRDRVKDAASSVMGIRTDAMNGDNLAITLASYFEDLLGERDLNGWPPEAQKACDEIEAAIVAIWPQPSAREASMVEWAKAQATKNAIVGFAKHDPEISVHLEALYGVADIAEDEITIVNDWGGEVSFPRSAFDNLGGYLAGTFIEEFRHD